MTGEIRKVDEINAENQEQPGLNKHKRDSQRNGAGVKPSSHVRNG